MVKFSSFYFAFIFLLSACGPAGKLPEEQLLPSDSIRLQDIEIFDFSDKNTFSQLPLRGDIRDNHKFWSGDYWPFQKNSINHRWNALTEEGKLRPSPERDQIPALTLEELAELSPAEKWDLYLGRYDYPLTNEVKAKSNPNAKEWEGICDGWAAATIHHPEPGPRTLRNPDGVLVPFGSADVKALLSYYYAFYHQVPTTHQIGKRCENNRRIFRSSPPECKDDLNAGSFHLALVNSIGLKNTSFLMDIKRYKEVWNQPVVAFHSQILNIDDSPGRRTTEGTHQVLRIRSDVTYVDNSEFNTWYPINGTEGQRYKTLTYEYLLYLNASDEVIGGEWKSSERPDFIWRKPAVGRGNFKGVLEFLDVLI